MFYSFLIDNDLWVDNVPSSRSWWSWWRSWWSSIIWWPQSSILEPLLFFLYIYIFSVLTFNMHHGMLIIYRLCLLWSNLLKRYFSPHQPRSWRISRRSRRICSQRTKIHCPKLKDTTKPSLLYTKVYIILVHNIQFNAVPLL